MKRNWDEEDRLKKARKRKVDKKKKMRVSGKNVFTIQKELRKKQDTHAPKIVWGETRNK